jgi:hypothetical protein
MRSRSKIQDPKISLQSIHSIQSIRPNLTMPNLDLLLLNCKLQLAQPASANSCGGQNEIGMFQLPVFTYQCLHIRISVFTSISISITDPKKSEFQFKPTILTIKNRKSKKEDYYSFDRRRRCCNLSNTMPGKTTQSYLACGHKLLH